MNSTLSPTETVTFVVGILMCVIGVASFIVGMTSRAKSDGVLSNKVDSAIQGIEEIKKSLESQRDWRESVSVKLEGQSQQISTLFRRVEAIEADLRYRAVSHPIPED